MTFQGILAAKALVTVGARERLNSEMYSLMPLEIMITVETLRALVAPEWSLLVGH